MGRPRPKQNVKSKAPEDMRVENDVKHEIKKVLDEFGWKHWAVSPGVFGSTGMSDRICLKSGVFMAVEAKRNSPLTFLQRKFLKEVIAEGSLGFVVDHNRVIVFRAFLAAFNRAQAAQMKSEYDDNGELVNKVEPGDGAMMLDAMSVMQRELFE